MAEPTPAPRKRSTAARRARARALRGPDGMDVARAAQAELDAAIAAAPTVEAKPSEPLRFSLVPEPAPAKPVGRPTRVRIVKEELAEPAPVASRVLTPAQRVIKRQNWTVDDARYQLEQGYSPDQVEFQTGYSRTEFGG